MTMAVDKKARGKAAQMGRKSLAGSQRMKGATGNRSTGGKSPKTV